MARINGEDLFEVTNINLSKSNGDENLDKVTPGSDLSLDLEIFSYFPMNLQLKQIQASLIFHEHKEISEDQDKKSNQRRNKARLKMR